MTVYPPLNGNENDIILSASNDYTAGDYYIINIGNGVQPLSVVYSPLISRSNPIVKSFVDIHYFGITNSLTIGYNGSFFSIKNNGNMMAWSDTVPSLFNYYKLVPKVNYYSVVVSKVFTSATAITLSEIGVYDEDGYSITANAFIYYGLSTTQSPYLALDNDTSTSFTTAAELNPIVTIYLVGNMAPFSVFISGTNLQGSLIKMMDKTGTLIYSSSVSLTAQSNYTVNNIASGSQMLRITYSGSIARSITINEVLVVNDLGISMISGGNVQIMTTVATGSTSLALDQDLTTWFATPSQKFIVIDITFPAFGQVSIIDKTLSLAYCTIALVDSSNTTLKYYTLSSATDTMTIPLNSTKVLPASSLTITQDIANFNSQTRLVFMDSTGLDPEFILASDTALMSPHVIIKIATDFITISSRGSKLVAPVVISTTPSSTLGYSLLSGSYSSLTSITNMLYLSRDVGYSSGFSITNNLKASQTISIPTSFTGIAEIYIFQRASSSLNVLPFLGSQVKLSAATFSFNQLSLTDVNGGLLLLFCSAFDGLGNGFQVSGSTIGSNGINVGVLQPSNRNSIVNGVISTNTSFTCTTASNVGIGALSIYNSLTNLNGMKNIGIVISSADGNSLLNTVTTTASTNYYYQLNTPILPVLSPMTATPIIVDTPGYFKLKLDYLVNTTIFSISDTADYSGNYITIDISPNRVSFYKKVTGSSMVLIKSLINYQWLYMVPSTVSMVGSSALVNPSTIVGFVNGLVCFNSQVVAYNECFSLSSSSYYLLANANTMTSTVYSGAVIQLNSTSAFNEVQVFDVNGNLLSTLPSLDIPYKLDCCDYHPRYLNDGLLTSVGTLSSNGILYLTMQTKAQIGVIAFYSNNSNFNSF
jgi:hypothetical protein